MSSSAQGRQSGTFGDELTTSLLRRWNGRVAVGDPVELWGPELPVERIAEASATIGYELTCSITRRVRFVET